MIIIIIIMNVKISSYCIRIVIIIYCDLSYTVNYNILIIAVMLLISIAVM